MAVSKMSHYAIHGAIRKYRSFRTVRHKSLMHSLVTYGDSDGKNIFPGLKRLSEDENCSSSTVIRVLGELERAGFIVTTDKKGGRGRVTHYEINLKKLGIELENNDFTTQNTVTLPITPILSSTNGHTPPPNERLLKKYERRDFLTNALREMELKHSPNADHYRDRLAQVEAEITTLESENLQNVPTS